MDIKRILRFGILVGLVGGTLMALFAMVLMLIQGKGFLTAVNLFANTFWRDAPTDGTFNLGALVLGTAAHLTIAVSIGIVIALLVERGQLDGGVIFLLAVGAGATAWVIQALTWSSINENARDMSHGSILAVAHVVFAVGSASFFLWLRNHDEKVAVAAAAASRVTDPDPGGTAHRRARASPGPSVTPGSTRGPRA